MIVFGRVRAWSFPWDSASPHKAAKVFLFEVFYRQKIPVCRIEFPQPTFGPRVDILNDDFVFLRLMCLMCFQNFHKFSLFNLEKLKWTLYGCWFDYWNCQINSNNIISNSSRPTLIRMFTEPEYRTRTRAFTLELCFCFACHNIISSVWSNYSFHLMPCYFKPPKYSTL